jgi:hypothetical protein
MINIDLLKGRGRAAKSSARNITIMAITVIVPTVAALVISGCYVHSKIVASIQQKRMADYQARIDQSPQTMEFQKNMQNEVQDITKSLSEVSASISKYMQWSGIMETVINNIPDSMILTRLEVEQKSLKAKNDDPKQANSLPVPVRTMHIIISGHPMTNYDSQVRQFKDSLLSSPLISQNLDQISVSRKSNVTEKKEIASYEIDCTFKPSI